MADFSEQIYAQGYEIGLAGIRSRCPEDIYNDDDHSSRDAWIDGYKAGWRQFRRDREGYNRLNIHHSEDTKGRLWITSKDKNGFQSIYDCEGGTLLAKIQIDPEPRVIVPPHNITPEMAAVTAKAVAKAASMAYTIRQARDLHLATSTDALIPAKYPKQRNAKTERDELIPLLDIWELAHHIQKNIKVFYWHLRNGQSTGNERGVIDQDIQALAEDFNEFTGVDHG